MGERLAIGLVSLFMALIFFMLAHANAAPYLVCDPQTGVESYVLDMDGTVTTEPAQALGDGTVRLHKDLAELNEGNHTCTLKADYGVWGESDESFPFLFTKPSMGLPSVLTITAE